MTTNELTADPLDLSTAKPLDLQISDRIQNFRDVAADRRAALVQISSDKQENWTQRANAETRVAEFKRGGVRDDAPPMVSLLSAIDRHAANIKRLNARTEELQPGWEQAQGLVASLESYVGAHGGRLALHQGPAPKLQDGENALDGLERASRRTRTLRADRQDILSRPFPSAMAKQVAWEALAARGEAAKPDVFRLVERLDPITWPVERVGNAERQDIVGTLAWLFPVELRKAIHKEIDANADDAAAMTIEQRRAALKIVDADILASEREECHFATIAGMLARADADPRAVLQLSDQMPAPRGDD